MVEGAAVALLGVFPLLLACGGSGEEPNSADFEFGRPELEEALFGTWVGSFTPTGADPKPLELEIFAAGDSGASRSRSEGSATQPGARLACNDRTLSESGPGLSPQCASATILAVFATARLGDEDPQDFDGQVRVYSKTLSYAEVELFSEGTWFELGWDADKGFDECRARADDGVVLGSCVLEERL